jgi:DNA-binding response OmpR family regulator
MSCRVLIVDDEPLIADNLAAMLTAAGHAVCGKTGSAAEAVRLAGELRPDVVLMDVKLPGSKDGIDAASAIVRAVGCGIVFVTAHADVATRVLIRSFIPAAEVLSKPVARSEVEAACARVLARPPGGSG